MTRHVLLLVLMCFTSVINPQVFEDQRIRADCRGTLTFRNGSGLTNVNESQLNIKIMSTTVLLNGCGCFRLFEKRNGKGKSQLIKRHGWQRIVIKTIQSITKIKCDNIDFYPIRKIDIGRSKLLNDGYLDLPLCSAKVSSLVNIQYSIYYVLLNCQKNR